MFITIISSVIGALFLAGIYAIFKSRWLYVIAPKLYLKTPISDGQIFSFDIYNAGLLAEEDVAVTFRSACNFELIATSKSTLAVSGKTLSIPKLSRLESITVLLLIEGKAFDPVDIESVESKSTTGKVVENKAKATALWQNIVVIPIIILFLGLPFAFGTVIGAETRVSAFSYIADKLEFFEHSKQLAGFKTSLSQKYNLINDENYIDNSKIAISTSEVVRRGDILTVKLKITNNSNDIFTVEGYSKSSAGEISTLGYEESRIENFGLKPKESRIVKLKAFLPEAVSIKLVLIDFTFSFLAGKDLHITQTMDFSDSSN